MPSSSVIACSPAPSSSPQGVPAQSGPVSSTSALSPIDQASQYFYRSIYPILKSANPNDLSAAREALVAALSNKKDRDLLLEFLGIAWLPREIDPKLHRLLADVVLEHAHSPEDSAWDALASADEYAAAYDRELYQHLGEARCNKQTPEESVFNSSGILSKILSANIAQDAHLHPWLRLFETQGTQRVFDVLRDELLDRINRGDLSCYEHIARALCSGNQPHGITALSSIFERYPRPVTSLPKAHDAAERTPPLLVRVASDGFIYSSQLITLSQLSVLSLHLQDPKPSLMSAWVSSMIIGFTWSYLKHCRPVTAIQVLHNPYATMPPRTRYALEAFTERIHELLEAQKDRSLEAERLLTETKLRLRKPPHAS